MRDGERTTRDVDLSPLKIILCFGREIRHFCKS